VRLENGRNYLTDWKLEDLPRFIKKLRPSDEIAVEVTGNTRLFRDAVGPHVARVVAVDPNQFKVISHSVKKTGPERRAQPGVVPGEGSAAGGEDEGQDTSAIGEPDADPGHAGEAADRAEK